MKSPKHSNQIATTHGYSLGGETGSPKLSILFITYRRVALLERTYYAIMNLLESCDFFESCYFETVVADDGSSPPEQDRIRELPFDTYVLSPKNRGLGANNNAGLRACKGQYILMMQDDWEATSDFPGALRDAISVMDADSQVGMVRFAGGDPRDFVLQSRDANGVEYFVCDHTIEGAVADEHVYSDTPHLRRAVLLEEDVLGAYREKCPMEESEENYSQRFEMQRNFFVSFMSENEMSFFKNIGISESHRTKKLRYKLDKLVRGFAAQSGLKKDSALYYRLKNLWFATRDLLIQIGFFK